MQRAGTGDTAQYIDFFFFSFFFSVILNVIVNQLAVAQKPRDGRGRCRGLVPLSSWTRDEQIDKGGDRARSVHFSPLHQPWAAATHVCSGLHHVLSFFFCKN